MLPEEVRTATQARAIVEERGLAHVKVGVFDNDGILRGKKHYRGLENGMSQEMRWFVGGQQAEAAERLAHSKAAQELFGAPFVSHFAASREWEEREFRRAVPDWELARYFEII